ncbi:MAG: RNA polymerase sigma factor [Verrucomicrobia bacterium]|nr:RNA polymerase sigma factor [Verrucomicrobiota bacterium]
MHGLDFQNLVDSFYAPLYRFGLSLARNEADACDLTQQTFALWARKGHQLRDSTKAKSWLFTTLYREFLGAARHQTRFPHQDLELVKGEIPHLEPGIVDELDAQTILQALGQLDEVYRASLSLFYLQEHSYKEISEILDVPIGTVMSRISRGKQQLRERLSLAAKAPETKTIPFPGRESQHG